MKPELKYIKREALEEQYHLIISCNGYEIDIHDKKLKEQIFKLLEKSNCRVQGK